MPGSQMAVRFLVWLMELEKKRARPRPTAANGGLAGLTPAMAESTVAGLVARGLIVVEGPRRALLRPRLRSNDPTSRCHSPGEPLTLPCFTTMRAAFAAVSAIEALKRSPLGVMPLQEWLGQ
jgi:hypothetical protein